MLKILGKIHEFIVSIPRQLKLKIHIKGAARNIKGMIKISVVLNLRNNR